MDQATVFDEARLFISTPQAITLQKRKTKKRRNKGMM